MQEELSKKFKESDLSDFPDFYSYKRPLDKALWVLWVAKDKFGVRHLTAQEISSIIKDSKEAKVKVKSIVQSLHRADVKIDAHSKNDDVYYEIMKEGKDHLRPKTQGLVEVFYFQPGKRYTPKRILALDILKNLKGELKIVDSYCSERTLDILIALSSRSVKFLTRTANLDARKKRKFLRELKEFKPENPVIEFRDYPKIDIHDRYVISSDKVVILGHSIKNLGEKESFAIILDRNSYKSIFESLAKNFDSRWKDSSPI